MSKGLSKTQKAGRMMRLLGWITLFLGLILGAAIAIPYLHGAPSPEQPASLTTVAVMFAVTCLLYLFVGSALKKEKRWARIPALLVSLIALLNFPIGTVLGVIILIYLIGGWKEKANVA